MTQNAPVPVAFYTHDFGAFWYDVWFPRHPTISKTPQPFFISQIPGTSLGHPGFFWGVYMGRADEAINWFLDVPF